MGLIARSESLFSGTVGADATGSAVTLLNTNEGVLRALVFYADITHNSGTSTLDIKIQHSLDGTTWRDLENFTQATTSDTSERININLDANHVRPLVRAVLDVGASGSPNYTVSVIVEWG
jgi:hypothetical protein